jgi:hypothetical protein
LAPAFIMRVLLAALYWGTGHPPPTRPSLCLVVCCARFPAVRPFIPPVGLAHHCMCRKATCARRTGFYDGSELSYEPGSGPSLPPHPDALSPLPTAPPCAASCVRVHQHIIPGGMSIPRRRSWPYRGAAVLNFVMTEFSEVRFAWGYATHTARYLADRPTSGYRGGLASPTDVVGNI